MKTVFGEIVSLTAVPFLPQARDAAVEAQTVTEGIYDYIENVESGSTLSTPTSSQAGENPFASDGLGDTVIHLDKVNVTC